MSLFGNNRSQIQFQSAIDQQRKALEQYHLAMANSQMQNAYGQGMSNSLGASASQIAQLMQQVATPVPAQPKKKLTEDFIVAEVVGWRRWTVAMFGETLFSNNGIAWKPYEKLTAECKARVSILDPAAGTGVCKGVNCTCGIYAYKEKDKAKTGDNSPTENTHIWGQVSLWGRIVECETGFRAQYAYPKAFVDEGGISQRMAYVYGVKLID